MAYYPSSLLKQKHVTYDPDARVWNEGYGKPPPYLQVVMSVHEKTYQTFGQEPPNPIKPDTYPPPAISTWMVSYSGSDIDIISLDTLECLGYDVESLMKVAPEARRMLREMEVEIKGGIFMTIRVTDPATMRSSQTRSLVYVANSRRNHLCKQTMESLALGGHRSLGDLPPLCIPQRP